MNRSSLKQRALHKTNLPGQARADEMSFNERVPKAFSSGVAPSARGFEVLPMKPQAR
jgi:hypothetical protein